MIRVSGILFQNVRGRQWSYPNSDKKKKSALASIINLVTCQQGLFIYLCAYI